MPAYFIVEIDVQDAAAFDQYRAQVPATIARYGGRYLVRGGSGGDPGGRRTAGAHGGAGVSEPGAGPNVL
jgi:uncharacterized protein (DUF1330 family)